MSVKMAVTNVFGTADASTRSRHTDANARMDSLLLPQHIHYDRNVNVSTYLSSTRSYVVFTCCFFSSPLLSPLPSLPFHKICGVVIPSLSVVTFHTANFNTHFKRCHHKNWLISAVHKWANKKPEFFCISDKFSRNFDFQLLYTLTYHLTATRFLQILRFAWKSRD